LYLVLSSVSIKEKLVWSAVLVLNIFGLTVSFSRAGLGAVVLTIILLLGWLLIVRWSNRKVVWLSVVIAAAFLAAFLCFHQFLSTRATFADNAVKARVFYDRLGWDVFKHYPWQGIGFGTSVLHMQEFSPIKLAPWEIQPIHNYYLLAAAELGLVGALLFIIFFLQHWVKLFQQLTKKNQGTDPDQYLYRLCLLTILTCCFILMLFDHYFYTIEQTQLLLWLVLGWGAGELGKNKTDPVRLDQL
jgi:O-antigen ligase